MNQWKSKSLRPLFVLLPLLLTACLNPGSVSQNLQAPKPKRDFQVQQAVDTSITPTMETFPLLVPLQGLTPATSWPKGKVYDVNLTTDPNRLHQDEIVVPATGAFKVIFQVGGNSRKLIDNDARDGVAVVSMPAGNYDGYVGADVTGSNQLTVENEFYYQKQAIVTGGITPLPQHGQKPALQTYQIGTRQLPTPANWLSPEGQNFVLKFTNQGTSTAAIRWYPSNSSVPMPMGVKEIGPAGGVIDLPNVGKLTVPSGALTTPTVIRMTQVLQAPSLTFLTVTKTQQKFIEQYEYATPVVQLEPNRLLLSQPAKLKLNTVVSEKSSRQNPHKIVKGCIFKEET